VAVGLVSFNLRYEINMTKSVETTYEGLLMVTLHEIGHLLGFAPFLYNSFINPLTGEKLLKTIM